MRQVTCFVNDYPAKRRMGIGFNAPDYEAVEKRWGEEDQRLLALQALPAFKGYKKWSDCRSEHFRVLIVRTMLLMEDMSDNDRADADHPVMTTFNFLVLCLVRCLEIATSSTVEILHINRLSATDIAFDFTAVMDLKFAQPPPFEEESPFKIIVDNTKDDK
jgi:hypothetical protein